VSDVFDRVREANPIKDIDRYAEVVAGLDEQLHGISWRERMMDDKPRVVGLEPGPAPSRRRWWIAAAAAVIVVAAAGIGFALGSSDGERADAVATTTPVTTTPMTTAGTQAPVTTMGEALTPLEVGELFMERWAAADFDGVEALIDQAATSRCYDCPDTTIWPWSSAKYRGIEERTMGLAYIGGSNTQYSCAAVNAMVTCSLRIDSRFEPNDPGVYQGSLERVDIFTVVDGLITHLDFELWPDYEGIFSVSIADYEQWLADVHPDEHDELFFLGTLLVNDRGQRDTHRSLVSEWAAGLGR